MAAVVEFTEPVLVWRPGDCARMWPYLREGIGRARAAGRSVPEDVIDAAVAVDRMARFAGEPLPGWPGAGAEPGNTGGLPGGASLLQPDRVLSVAAVATAAGCSQSYVRRCLRSGVLYGTQVAPGSEWAADAADAARWVASRRRKENERKAA